MVDSVSLTALLVSLVALLATVGQLLQQYYATADGLRRCQPSVMGLWARRTKIRFRWTEFRFETIFVTPRIIYGPIRIQDSGAEYTKPDTSKVFCDLVDTPGSLRASMTLPGWGSREARKYYDSDELVCWVPLLAQLHKQGRDAVQYFPQSPDSVANDTMIPTIQFVKKSWDFMPPDVVRPLASSTVGDVAIMARRLGMVWKTFDPGAGLMRAEGNGHVFTSTLVRSIGTILQYSYTSRDNLGNCFYIPAKEADKLGFGLVEFDHRLFGPLMKFDLDVGSLEGIAQSLPRLMRYRTSSQRDITETVQNISRNIKAGKDFIPGLNDLIPLCSAMLVSGVLQAPHSWLNRIPSPNKWSKGLLGCREGRHIFEKKLREFIERRSSRESQLPIRILSLLVELKSMNGSRWEDDETADTWEPRVSGAEISSRALLLHHHTEMTTFLQGSNVVYSVLVSEHMVQASGITFSPSETPYRELENADLELIWGMEAGFNVLPALVERVIRTHITFLDKPNLTKAEVEDAWFAMIFRAICWQLAHVMIPGVPPLPSEHWNSKMPIYIG
ncbi:hypothetical protein F5884DRAFT_849607 [Xylogone sp. PMI_703]|nr:hypothetical protein F5884DRAFT_849607 [Xylogone sp. PMI_703]